MRIEVYLGWRLLIAKEVSFLDMKDTISELMGRVKNRYAEKPAKDFWYSVKECY